MEKKMSKLKKMKMPEKKGEDMSAMEDSPELAAQEEEMGMDLDGDMEAGEPMEHAEKVMGADPASAQAVEALSDEDLMAEIKKRGLMAQLAESGEEEAADEHSILA